MDICKLDPVDIETNCHKKRIARHSHETLRKHTDSVAERGGISLQDLERVWVGAGIGIAIQSGRRECFD